MNRNYNNMVLMFSSPATAASPSKNIPSQSTSVDDVSGSILDSSTTDRILAVNEQTCMLNNTSLQAGASSYTLPVQERMPTIRYDTYTTRDFLSQSNLPLVNRLVNGTQNIYSMPTLPIRNNTGINETRNFPRQQPLHTSSNNRSCRSRHYQQRTVDWEDRLQMLIDFKKENGHCMVPQNHPHLGAWVKWQREKYVLYKKGKTSYFTPEKIDCLNRIGFVWRVRCKKKARQCNNELETESQSSVSEEVIDSSLSRKSKLQKKTQESSESKVKISHVYDVQKHKTSLVTNIADIPKVAESPETSMNDISSNISEKNSKHVISERCLQRISSSSETSYDKLDNTSGIFNTRRQMETEMTCKVCDNIYVKYSVCAPCNHSFCASCINTSLMRCAICQSKIALVVPVENVDNVILCMIKDGHFDVETVSRFLKRKYHDSS